MVILAFAFVVIVAALPGVVWLLFFLREDVHPEPRRLILYTFTIGILVSLPIVAIQILGQGFIFRFIPNLLVLILFLAFVEEIFKFFAAYLAVGKRKELDEPVDTMIYMIAAALGLATIENFFILSDLVSAGGTAVVADTAGIVVLRFIGATFLHAIASGLVGFYWAKSRMQGSSKYLWFGIFLATIVHGAFNYLILIFQAVNFLIFPALFLIFASFFLFKDFEKLKIQK